MANRQNDIQVLAECIVRASHAYTRDPEQSVAIDLLSQWALRRGLATRLPEVKTAIERIVQREKGITPFRVELARDHAKSLQSQIQEYLSVTFATKAECQFEEQTDLVAGFRATAETSRVRASLSDMLAL